METDQLIKDTKTLSVEEIMAEKPHEKNETKGTFDKAADLSVNNAAKLEVLN